MRTLVLQVSARIAVLLLPLFFYSLIYRIDLLRFGAFLFQIKFSNIRFANIHGITLYLAKQRATQTLLQKMNQFFSYLKWSLLRVTLYFSQYNRAVFTLITLPRYQGVIRPVRRYVISM